MIAPFITVMLHARTIDTPTIGILTAVSALAATVLVPAWGHLADVMTGRVVAFRIGLGVATAEAITLLLPLPPQVFAPILASFAIFPGLFIALADALGIGALAAPERQYGALRALASISFGAGVIGAGFVYDRFGYGAVPIVTLVWAGVLLLFLGRVPDATRDPAVRAMADHKGGDRAAGRFGSISRALSIQPRLIPVIAIFVLAFTGLFGSTTFVGIRLVELGGQPSDVALTFGIAALAEVPGLLLAGWIGRRIGMRWLVVVALVANGLLIVSWGILPSPLAINLTRIGTGLCFGALIAVRVLIVGRLLPDELQATGQAMFQAATFGLGSALGGIIGGALYGYSGATVYFTFAGAVAIASGLGAWFVLYGPLGTPLRADEAAL